MEIVRRVHSMKEACRQARRGGKKIGFVPTMGALHEGHLRLIRRARELADIVAVSIFVNPTQFDQASDFESYPREETADADRCISERVDYLFSPPAEELYPEGSQTIVDVTELSRSFEGASRPGHFRGVATVVLKLLQIVQPDFAVFGQKDLQQALVVRRMVRDLMLDVEIVMMPTVRDEDNVALSSRNQKLSAAEREAARAIPRALEAARQAIAEGQRQSDRVLAAVHEVLQAEERLKVDYVELVDRERLEPPTQVQGELALIIAAFLGETRLIDNVLLNADPPKQKKA